MKPENTLENLGYGVFWRLFDELAAPQTGAELGRVVSHHGSRLRVWCRNGEREAVVSGKLKLDCQKSSSLPVVGDWVLIAGGNGDGLCRIEQVLPRKSLLARSSEGETQAVAANVDYLVILWPLDKLVHEEKARFGLIHRFVTLAHSGDMDAIIVFSKSDLIPLDQQREIQEKAQRLWPAIPVLFTSSVDESASLNRRSELEALLPAASTSVLAGSSGAGKSTLIKQLSGEESIVTQEVRSADSKGKHTTTHRELYRLESGVLLVDNPGIRSLSLLGDSDAVDASFAQLADLAKECRFTDCSHGNEPGCKVREALELGTVDQDQFRQWLKQKAEMNWQRSRDAASAQKDGQLSWADKQVADARKNWQKNIHKHMKGFSKERRTRE